MLVNIKTIKAKSVQLNEKVFQSNFKLLINTDSECDKDKNIKKATLASDL